MTQKEKQERFIQLYSGVKDNIWRYCLFMAKNREFAKDLLGETLASAYEGFNSLSNEKAFLSFLFTISSRIYYKLKRKKDSARFVNVELDSLFVQNLSADIITDISLLYECLNKLPEEQKEALILHNIEGFSRKEVAEIQKVSEETVKSRLALGKKKLSQLMGIDDEERA
ncbi:MAG: RNA polymerase sigma factor [Bacteroidetes bacterium]|nr:MAG: RNA polymerase sigma factor [Bacteroidota bacterium]